MSISQVCTRALVQGGNYAGLSNAQDRQEWSGDQAKMEISDVQIGGVGIWGDSDGGAKRELRRRPSFVGAVVTVGRRTDAS